MSATPLCPMVGSTTSAILSLGTELPGARGEERGCFAPSFKVPLSSLTRESVDDSNPAHHKGSQEHPWAILGEGAPGNPPCSREGIRTPLWATGLSLGLDFSWQVLLWGEQADQIQLAAHLHPADTLPSWSLHTLPQSLLSGHPDSCVQIQVCWGRREQSRPERFLPMNPTLSAA